jgi:hypothetical protein
MVVERKTLTGKLNVDASYKTLPKGDYQNALNIRVFHGADGDIAVVKNTPSNRLVDTELVDQTDYRSLGTIEDPATRRVFYFVFGSEDEYILCYRKDTDDIVPVLKGSDTEEGLNFQNEPITGIALLGDKLYWTEPGEVNQPRMINVERGIKTYDGSYTPPNGQAVTAYNIPLAEEDLTVIRRQPKYPLELTKVDSSGSSMVPDQDNNFIENAAFQFSYYYEYTDGETSTLGPWSKVANYNFEDDTFDTIKVNIPDEEEVRDEVSAIRVVVRSSTDVAVNNTNNWRVIKSWRRSIDGSDMDAHNTGTLLTFYFFNDFIGTAVPEAEAIKPFDSVPIYSEALEAGRDRLLLGNNIEGYDPVDSVGLTASVVTQTGGSLTAEYILVSSETLSPADQNVALLVNIIGSGDPLVDGYYEYDQGLSYETDFNDGTLPTIITLSSADRIGAASDFTTMDLLELYSPGGGAYDQPPSYVDFTYTGTQPTVLGLETPLPIEDTDRVFPVDSAYRVGIVYFDFAGRNAGVYTNDDSLVVTADRTITQAIYNTAIEWSLPGATTDIPEWATHYAIVLTKNLTKSFFVWHSIEETKYVSFDDDGLRVYADTYTEGTTAEIAWDISRLIEPGLGYQYSDGSNDFLKIYPTDDSDPVIYRITGQGGKWVYTDAKDLGDLSGVNIYEGSTFEIYTPYYGSENETYFEYGGAYAITNPGLPGRSHSVTMGSMSGDTYVLSRDVDGSTIYVEAMSPNDDYWNRWNTDHGRSFIEILDSGQERRLTDIAYSNTYVRGSSIRGLSTFDALDKTTLDDAIGPIRKLVLTSKAQSDGTVLLTIGEEETASVYLGETQFVDNQADSIVATSGAVIGTVNVLRGSYGTIHPESVVENNGRVYWYDYNRARVLRYANGIYPISDAGMKSFWSRISRQAAASLKFFGGYDEFTDEYLIAIPDIEDYTGSEYFTDLEDYIGGLSIANTPGISSLYAVEETRPYRIEVSGLDFDGTSTLVFTAGGQVIYNEVPTESDFVIEFTGAANNNIGYAWGGNAGGFWLLYGAEISTHQLFSGRGKTLAFRDIQGLEGWSTAYSFLPEQFARIGDKLISFINGELWVHDDADSWNTFYGKPADCLISVVANIPSPPKVGVAVSLESDTIPSRVHVRNEQPLQSTYTSTFREREQLLYSAIKRDRLDPNGTGDYDDKMASARKLRGQFLQVSVEYQTFNEELNLRYIDIKYNISSGHLGRNAQ